jgi:hypothetical protein
MFCFVKHEDIKKKTQMKALKENSALLNCPNNLLIYFGTMAVLLLIVVLFLFK